MKTLRFVVDCDGEGFRAQENGSDARQAMMVFTTAKEYAALNGTKPASLAEDEILLSVQGKRLDGGLTIDFSNSSNPKGATRTYRIVDQIEKNPFISDDSAYRMDVYYVVLADDAVLQQLYRDQVAAYAGNASMIMLRVLMDIDGTMQEQNDCAEAVSDASLIGADSAEVGSWEVYSLESRAANASDVYSLNGGFFFLGTFLGFLFIMATVLIIYYKQMTEGYEDRERFQIMQKVGLDREEIKRSINAQILVVFFAPIFVAAVHVAFDFRLVRLMLTLFGLTNATLTLLCTIGTLLLFMVIYGIVYALTAKAYYRIVS
jgi:putative ABC transport system permease protein